MHLTPRDPTDWLAWGTHTPVAEVHVLHWEGHCGTQVEKENPTSGMKTLRGLRCCPLSLWMF